RKRLALAHTALLEPGKFENDVVGKINPAAHVHDELFKLSIGYSDEAESGRYYKTYRLTGANTQPMVWVKRVFAALEQPLDHGDAALLVQRIIEKLGDPDAEFLVPHTVTDFHRQRHELWMVNPAVIQLQADTQAEHWRCPKCGTVQRLRALHLCTGLTCRTALKRDDLTDNYFRRVYATPLGEAVPVIAEEHSGQVSGEERREIEIHFRDEKNPLNVLICTPTMELGIDIGHLNAVTLRNVPPSPSNYAQRAGRAGRSGQPALISVFAGVGAARGPHDQYFYRFPEKMIAGAIAAPRFRLDNQALITTHIHALVLETLGLHGAEKLPVKPQDLLDLARPGFPLYADWQTTYQQGITRHFQTIVHAVETAFAAEIARFDWFDRAFSETCILHFLDDLDAAMARWRVEYGRLDNEREALNLQLGKFNVDYHLDRRRSVIERKLEQMREGQRDWYLYRYLGGEGFLPGYAFPPQATILSLDDREDEMPRDPGIALTEYAPGNFVYYRGQRYEITHARPRRRQAAATAEPQTELDIEPVLLCPACQRAYMGEHEVKRARCECGADLSGVHPWQGMELTDMYAQERARITADEEERMRLGYVVSPHYRAGGQLQTFQVSSAGRRAFGLTLEHNGEVLLINRGQREPEGDPQGFTLCRKCYRWLVGKDAGSAHLSTVKERGECPRNASDPNDLAARLWLTKLLRSDLAIFDVPLPANAEPAIFYTTLLYTLLRALMVAFNLDESELGGFLSPVGDAVGDVAQRIIIYETAVGGSGVLAALGEPGRLAVLVQRARELLHEGDPEGGCEKACYACLLSFYNQRDHDYLDRQAVLPWLQALAAPEAVSEQDNEEQLPALLAQCQSELERQVLQAI
ncbi:MAG: helicase-related protein, partial [Anaerolineae bacterium]|nr:helicase-related protein [Anaerolineae bacterium]